MPTAKDLRNITNSRLKTVNILMKASDWEAAGYMMGYVLECGLKAIICKQLRLNVYPDNHKRGEITKFFRTHKFDPLLLVSGLSKIFGTTGDIQAFQNWSDFTNEYAGEWSAMRYDVNITWDEDKIKKLYLNLTDKPYGVLTIIKKRW